MAEGDSNWLDRAQAQTEALTPETGFNVVAVDDFKFAGDDDALYLVGHYDDAVEAERACAEHEADTGDKAHVYPARPKS